MTTPRTLTVYLVQQVGWAYNDEWYDRLDRKPRDDEFHDPSYVPDPDFFNRPLKAFRDRAKAEAYARELDRAARSEFASPPGLAGPNDLAALTTLSEERFIERARELGLISSENGGSRPWANYLDLTTTQMEAYWDLCDLVRFYEVVETTVELEA